MSTVTDAIAEQAKKPTRDEIRAKVFSSENQKPKSRIIPFFGVDIEIRQPTMGQIMAAREGTDEDRKNAVIDTLINHSYVPGTDDKVFELTDEDGFKAMPFGEDFVRVATTLGELSGVNFQAQNKG